MKEYAKNWLSLGWLTDPQLARALKDRHKKVCETAGMPVPFSNVVKDVLRRGLEAYEAQAA